MFSQRTIAKAVFSQRTTPKAVCSQRTTTKAVFTQPMDDPKSCIDAVSRLFQKLRSVSGRPQRLCSRSQWTIPKTVSTQSMDDPKGCVHAVNGQFQRLYPRSQWTIPKAVFRQSVDDSKGCVQSAEPQGTRLNSIGCCLCLVNCHSALLVHTMPTLRRQEMWRRGFLEAIHPTSFSQSKRHKRYSLDQLKECVVAIFPELAEA